MSPFPLGILGAAHVAAGVTFAGFGTAAIISTSATIAVPYPADCGAGDALICVCVDKYRPSHDIVPTDFTQLAEFSDGTVSGTTDGGSMQHWVGARYPTGSVSGTETLTNNGTSNFDPGIAIMGRWYGAGTWDVAVFTGTDGDTADTAVSATITGTSSQIIAGDHLLVAASSPSDSTFASEAISVPGCTLSVVSAWANTGTNLGYDGALHLAVYLVESGTCSGDSTFTATAALAARSTSAVSITRLRAA